MNNPNDIIDAAERNQALDPTESFIIQAPAGSGKTELLTQRYLGLLARAEHAPEEIIAITFTRKAAAEMRTRVIAALQRAHETAPDTLHAHKTWELARAVLQRDLAANWQILTNPHRLRIQTIDALCAQLTRQLPTLAKFGAQPEVTDSAENFYQQAARNMLSVLEDNTESSEALATLLLHLDNDMGKAQRLLIDMLKQREQWLPHILAAKQSAQPRQQLEQSLININKKILVSLGRNLPARLSEELLSLWQFAVANVALDHPFTDYKNRLELPTTKPNDKDYWIQLANLLLTKDYKWRARIDKNNGFPATAKEMKQRMMMLLAALETHEAFRQSLQDIVEAPPIQYNEQQWEVIAALVQLLPPLAAELQLVFKEQGCVDYNEIATCALTALGTTEEPTDLALALDYRIQHILVDEFQDTSATQYHLLELLTAGWYPGDGRTLFLVGDPMQSIYRFRKAEVGLFLRAKDQGIGEVNLNSLSLKTNFRSEQGIVAWVNQTFQRIMPKNEDISLGAVPFCTSYAARAAGNKEAIIVHPMIEADTQIEANKIVTIITQTLSEQPLSSIAILVKARTHLAAILPALQQAGLIYRAIEIEMLAENSVIQDLLALTSALLHPANRVAWLAILRAPWCGLTLADLHLLVGEDHHVTLWQRIQQKNDLSLSAEGSLRLERIYRILKQSLNQRRRLPLSQWIESTWLALGGPACLTQENELNDANTFFSLLATLDQGGDVTSFADLTAKLKKLFAAPTQLSHCQIDVMTIHKAKGLEFDTVILPGLHRQPRIDEQQLLLWMERPTTTDIDLVLGPIKAAESTQDPIYNYLRREDNKKAAYETGRLLYVAATRAKKFLHLLGNVKLTTEGEINPPQPNSLLGQLWPQLMTDFLNAKAPTSSQVAIKPLLKPQPIRRLTSEWNRDHAAPISAVTSFAPTPKIRYISREYTLRHVGTVIHRAFKHITQQGIAIWTDEKIRAHRPYYTVALKQLGVLPHDLEEALNTIETALLKTVNDPRGRWLLDHSHIASQVEYPLTAQLDDKIISIILDRTFIDDEGIRWIVDYKTGDNSEIPLEKFLDNEQQRYSSQLSQYAAVMQKIDARPIRLGLYFPLCSGWREWDAMLQSQLLEPISS